MSRILITLLKLSGSQPEILDSDAGSYALRAMYPDARKLGWSLTPMQIPEILNTVKNNNFVVDPGANLFATGGDIATILVGLEQEWRDLGRETVALCPVTPNKSGNAGSITQMFNKIDYVHKYIVLNDRDGSGNFDRALLDMDHIRLGHLKPGFQQYLLMPPANMYDAVMSPPPGYEIAASYIAYWLIDFANQKIIQSLIGTDAVEALIQKYPTRPPALRISVNDINGVTNDRLTESAKYTVILNGLDRHRWSAEGLEALAAEMRATEAANIAV